jgi:hypothetical protein
VEAEAQAQVSGLPEVVWVAEGKGRGVAQDKGDIWGRRASEQGEANRTARGEEEREDEMPRTARRGGTWEMCQRVQPLSALSPLLSASRSRSHVSVATFGATPTPRDGVW